MEAQKNSQWNQRKISNSMRQAKKIEGYTDRGIQSPMCTREQAQEFLSISSKTFGVLESDYRTKIRRSFMMRGKFITKSIEEEALRVHTLLPEDIRYKEISL
jgi:hypothetical protein